MPKEKQRTQKERGGGKKERKKEEMVKRQTGEKTKQNRQRLNVGAIVIS